MKLSLYNLNQTEDVHSYNKALDALEDAHPFYKVSFLDIFTMDYKSKGLCSI